MSDDYNPELRHNIGIDCVSILENDGFLDENEPEETALANLDLINLICKLPSDRDKFLAVCLAFDIKKKDIARMLKIDSSWVSCELVKIRQVIKEYNL